MQDFYHQKIPNIDTSKSALDYHQIEIATSGIFNQEPLVDLRDYKIACKSIYVTANAPYYRSFTSALPSVLTRKSVAEKLKEVNKTLSPYDVHLLAFDGYRPIALQNELWNHFIEKGKEHMPQASEDELSKFAGQFCSDPRDFREDDFRTWPVHNTGGAIDLTLCSLHDNQELFMGSIFDDADKISSTRYFENESLTSQSALEARRNRRLLYNAMISVGFTNYHYEWWHFDFGTQMWVMNGDHNCNAYYGRATLKDKLSGNPI